MKILITLGPTQEPLDSVRYITNASSGIMGKCLANEAIKRKFDTTIIAGPVSISLPEKAKILYVRTAEEMINKTIDELKKNEYKVFISAAAIGDFKASKIVEGKIESKKQIKLILVPTPKLTKIVKEKFPEIFVVGFKAEYKPKKDELLKKGVAKLLSENLDLVVANDLSKSIGSETSEVYLIDKKRVVEHIALNTKKIIAKRIFEKILESMKDESKFCNIK